jgi:hypothetical protein
MHNVDIDTLVDAKLSAMMKEIKELHMFPATTPKTCLCILSYNYKCMTSIEDTSEYGLIL